MLPKWSHYHLTYHRFSEYSLKWPLSAKGFLDPKTCNINSRPNSLTTVKTNTNVCFRHGRGGLESKHHAVLQVEASTLCSEEELLAWLLQNTVINVRGSAWKLKLKRCQPVMFLSSTATSDQWINDLLDTNAWAIVGWFGFQLRLRYLCTSALTSLQALDRFYRCACGQQT